MPKQLYNEGRVVGYSAYEQYVKHSLSIGNEPSSENEWLASSLAMGTSLLLKVNFEAVEAPTNTGEYCSFKLPDNSDVTSNLCAANSIIANLFVGSGNSDGISAGSYGMWATSIDSFSLANSSGTTQYLMDKSTRKQIKSYMSIVDGYIEQPRNSDGSVKLGDVPSINLKFDPYNRPLVDFWILFTGFTDRSVIGGVSGLDDSVNTNSPENGDFLGPAVFPKAAKILFSVPPSFAQYYLQHNFRSDLYSVLGSGSSIVAIDSSVSDKTEDAKLSIQVYNQDTIGGEAAAIIAARPHKNVPYALYGNSFRDTAFEDNKGTQKYIYPLDIASPGTVKIFDDSVDWYEWSGQSAQDRAANVTRYYPYNLGMYRNYDGIIYQHRKSDLHNTPISNTQCKTIQSLKNNGITNINNINL